MFPFLGGGVVFCVFCLALFDFVWRLYGVLLFWFWLCSGGFVCLFFSFCLVFGWLVGLFCLNTKLSIMILVIGTHFGLENPRKINRQIYSIFYIISVIFSALK